MELAVDQTGVSPQPPDWQAAPPPSYWGAQYQPPTPQYYYSPPPPKRRLTWLYVLIGVVVVALVASGAFWLLLRSPAPNPTPEPTPSAPVGHPEDAVLSYLRAVANGDATDALTYLARQPASTALLSDDVLAASQQLAPITNISVTAPAGDLSVDSSFNIGDAPVTATFDVERQGDSYKVSNGLINADFSGVYRRSLGLSVNGVALDGTAISSVPLFPGVYQLKAGNPLVQLAPDKVTMQGPDADPVVSATFDLTDDAQGTLAAAVTKELKSCLAQKSLVTHCGFGVKGLQGGATVVPSSIKWTLASGSTDFSKAEFVMDSSLTSAAASISISVKSTCLDTLGRSYYIDPIHIVGADVDFSDPENLLVSFS